MRRAGATRTDVREAPRSHGDTKAHRRDRPRRKAGSADAGHVGELEGSVLQEGDVEAPEDQSIGALGDDLRRSDEARNRVALVGVVDGTDQTGSQRLSRVSCVQVTSGPKSLRRSSERMSSSRPVPSSPRSAVDRRRSDALQRAVETAALRERVRRRVAVRRTPECRSRAPARNSATTKAPTRTMIAPATATASRHAVVSRNGVVQRREDRRDQRRARAEERRDEERRSGAGERVAYRGDDAIAACLRGRRRLRRPARRTGPSDPELRGAPRRRGRAGRAESCLFGARCRRRAARPSSPCRVQCCGVELGREHPAMIARPRTNPACRAAIDTVAARTFASAGGIAAGRARRRGSPSPRPHARAPAPPPRPRRWEEPERDEAPGQRHTAGDLPTRDASREPPHHDRAERQAAHDDRTGERLPTPHHDEEEHGEEERADQRAVQQEEAGIRQPGPPGVGAVVGSPPREHDGRPPRRSAKRRVAPAAGRCCAS